MRCVDMVVPPGLATAARRERHLASRSGLRRFEWMFAILRFGFIRDVTDYSSFHEKDARVESARQKTDRRHRDHRLDSGLRIIRDGHWRASSAACEPVCRIP